MKPLYNRDTETSSECQGVVIKDIHMKFGSMVWFMVKWVFASIPAMFIIAAIVWVIVLILSLIGFGLKSINL